jgi:hypothetical protein
MTAWVLAGARSQPVVLAFEDLQWADPTSLDLMRALAERGAQAPLLLIATARPEFRPPWSLRSQSRAPCLMARVSSSSTPFAKPSEPGFLVAAHHRRGVGNVPVFAILKSAAWCASRQSSTPRTFARRFG